MRFRITFIDHHSEEIVAASFKIEDPFTLFIRGSAPGEPITAIRTNDIDRIDVVPDTPVAQ